MNPRGATVADLRRFAARLPEVEPGTSWGAGAHTVRGKAFVVLRDPVRTRSATTASGSPT